MFPQLSTHLYQKAVWDESGVHLVPNENCLTAKFAKRLAKDAKRISGALAGFFALRGNRFVAIDNPSAGL
jgi:hypothetical protein